MSWSSFPPPIKLLVRHKVFISFHSKDLYYKNRFDQLFSQTFINKSVKFGDVASDVADVYIKRLIREDYVSDASVIVVLVGPETHCRKHVDWEISAALSKKARGYSGLLGLCLPHHPDFVRNEYNAAIVPQRLVDNLQSGYALFYNWTEDPPAMKLLVETAFQDRISKSDQIQNWRPQLTYNRC